MAENSFLVEATFNTDFMFSNFISLPNTRASFLSSLDKFALSRNLKVNTGSGNLY